MKRFSAVLLTVLILCLSLCPMMLTASAAGSDWVLAKNAEYITHDDKVFYPVNSDRTYVIDYEDEEDDFVGYYTDLDFADAETKSLYMDSSLYNIIYDPEFGEPIALDVEIWRRDSYVGTTLYVEKSHLAEYEKLAQGDSSTYSTDNFYDTEMTISRSEFDSWCNGTPMTITAYELMAHDQYYIYASDNTGKVEYECAMVLRDYKTDELYLLRYSEYDRSYFYSDGTFAIDNYEDVTVYILEDPELEKRLLDCYDTIPEDDLDWIVTEDVSTGVALVFCTVVFGVLPLILVGLAITLMVVVKDKKYRRAFIIMLVGSAIVILAYVAVLLILI
ncbi:MAG: hypothetical protein IJC86_02465 [Clostridia bacterium]|nr:hypothetical protein [Clostridia bacterium]